MRGVRDLGLVGQLGSGSVLLPGVGPMGWRSARAMPPNRVVTPCNVVIARTETAGLRAPVSRSVVVFCRCDTLTCRDRRMAHPLRRHVLRSGNHPPNII